MARRGATYHGTEEFDRFIEEGMGPERLLRRRGGLRYFILWILSGRCMNGSELISEIQNQTLGWWRPSPGSVYPMLSRLENEKLILRETDGRFSLTGRGLEAIGHGYGRERGLSESDWTADRLLTEAEQALSYLEGLQLRTEGYEQRLQEIRKSVDRMLKKKA